MKKTLYREGAKADLQGVVSSLEKGRFTSTATCKTCGTVETRTATSVEPPRVAAYKMEQRGWRLGKTMACPACIEAERAAARSAKVAKMFPAQLLPQGVELPPPPVSLRVDPPFVIEAIAGPCDVPPMRPDLAAVDVARTALANGNTLVEVLCDKCGVIGKAEIAGAGTQQTAVKRFRAMGWSAGAGGTFCPDHAGRKPAPQLITLPTPEAKPETPTMTNVSPIHVPSADNLKAASTAAAKAAKRKAFELLDVNFDSATGTFRAEWSDERVAVETGMALQPCVILREEMFGELKVPPALDELRAEVVKARQNAQAAAGSATLAANAANTAADDCRALEARLTALVKTNGWRE